MALPESTAKKSFWRRKTVWVNIALAIGILFVIGLIFGALAPKPAEAPSRTATVERGDVISTVTATGTVETADPLELSFITPGIVTALDIEEGDTVIAGQVLARIDDTAARQQLASAELVLAQSKDAVDTQGVSQDGASTSVSNARTALAAAQRAQKIGNDKLDEGVAQAKANLASAKNLWSPACLTPDSGGCPNPAAAAAIRSADNAVKSAKIAHDQAVALAAANISGYTTNVDQAKAQLDQARLLQVTTCDNSGSTSTACISARGGLLTAQQTYDSAVAARTSGTEADNKKVESSAQALSSAEITLQKTQADLAKVGSDAVRSADQALANAESARRAGRLQNQQTVDSAQTALDSALAAQASGSAGTSALKEGVRSAKVGVEVAQQALDRTSLTSPISGTVSDVAIAVGESSAANAASANVTIIPDRVVEVVADFAETDAAGIQIGDLATVTFEALPGVTSQARVIAISTTAETSATGLVTYPVRIALDEVPDGVRAGMTAEVAVVIDEVTGVLVLPQGAITSDGDRSTVELLGPNNERTVVDVVTGVQGDVVTEVSSGVAEGEVVVIPSAENGVGLSFPGGGPPGENRPPAQGAN